MLKVDLYNQQGEKKGQVSVSEEVFGQKFNADLVHQALIRQHSNARLGMIAHTKTRAEVRGGGRKPFKQKGTGRARQGTTRSPNHIGGGVVFGPRNNKNYKKDMPKKQRRKALFCALSVKMAENGIFALDTYKADAVKTKTFVEMMAKLPIKKNALFVLPEKNELMAKSSKNISTVKTILVNYLNIADLQKYEQIVFLEEALKNIETTFNPVKES